MVTQSSYFDLLPTNNDYSIRDIALVSENEHSKIYSAISFGKRVILKTINTDHVEQSIANYLLDREWDMLRQLNSPYIVNAWQLAYIETIGRCIVMEYVEGRTLDVFIKENPSRSVRKKVLNEIFEAIEYIHSKQIVHADLKPENIIITTNGNYAKIIDFGISDNDALLQKNIGYTTIYAAPEQLSNGITDERTDVYALGNILKLLFPHSYIKVRHKSLRDNPNRRYQTVNTLKYHFNHYYKRLFSSLLFTLFTLIIIATSFILFHSEPRQQEQEPSLTIDTVNITPPIVYRDTVIIYVPSTTETPTNRQEITNNITAEVIDSLHTIYQQMTNLGIAKIDALEMRCYEFAFCIVHETLQDVWKIKEDYLSKYEEIETEIETDFMVRYNRLYKTMYQKAQSLPTLDSLYKVGSITLAQKDSLNTIYVERLKESTDLR